MSVPEPSVHRPTLIYRQLAIEVEAFDLMKSWQRHLASRDGHQLTNSQVLNFILKRQPGPPA